MHEQTGTFYMLCSGVGKDNSVTGNLDIPSNLTLVGNGASNTILDALSYDLYIHVLCGKTMIKGITMQNGLSLNSGGGLYVNSGARVNVVKSVFTRNVASYDAGAMSVSFFRRT